MALPLSVSMMNKVMRRKWSDFKLTSTMYEILNKQGIFYQLNIYALTQMPLQMVIPNIEH